MKHLTRLTALLLCAAMLLALIGCGAAPDPTPTAAPTEAPTEPSVSGIYAAAYEKAAQTSALSMNINSVMTTSVAGQSFTQNSEQTIYYDHFGTDDLAFRSSEAVTYAGNSYTYEETYIDGKLYATLDHTQQFCQEMETEDAAQRFLSPLMLDAALYGSITSGADGAILFENPTAAEAWAMPEGAEMTSTSGSALISAEDSLEKLAYTITYQYGPAEITLAVEADLLYGPTTVKAPSNADGFVTLEDVDALYLYMNAMGLLKQSGSVSISALESITSQAAAVVRNQSAASDLYLKDGRPNAKIETNVYMMDYSTGQSQELKQEELYVDGKYTVAIDDAEPQEQAGVTDEIILDYSGAITSSRLIEAKFWQDAVISDLGSTLLIELTYRDEVADSIEGNICETFWYDSQFLRSLSSAYAIQEMTGYFAIDKFLGLPTAAGYYYEGTHTIEGTDYILSLQSDQSIDGAAMNTYYNITETLLPEEEPETKATPLFYHVTGENGQEMWLMGTIHVGDERTAYLPQEIYDAFAASDALALEFDSEAFEEAMEEDDTLQDEVSGAYYYSDGTQTSDHVDEDVYEEAVKYLKASGNYTMNAPYMKPSLWSNSIENFYLRQGYHLTGEQGMEERLTQLAHEQGKEILDVESGLFQMKMLTGWSEPLHAQLLEDSLDTDAQEYFESVAELYELWCAGDEAAMREELRSTVDTTEMTEEEKAEYEEQKPLIDEYNKAMSYDRNDGMLDVAIEYLESGDVIFYAVGLAHLLDDVNGLVDTLRAAGYTVELVEYAK